jgi:mRNA-capping enzyme
MVCPPTPEWKRASDLDLNGEAAQYDDDDVGDQSALSHVSSCFK